LHLVGYVFEYSYDARTHEWREKKERKKKRKKKHHPIRMFYSEMRDDY
jgi:hypothetical protein